MPTYVRTQEIEHEIGGTGAVSIRVTDADVQLRAAEGGLARIRATFEIRAANDEEADGAFRAVQLRVDRGAGSLIVEEPDQRGGGLREAIASLIEGRAHAGLSIEAEVPTSCELRIETVSGDLNATRLAGQQHYSTVSGDLLLNEAAGEISTNAVSGDVTLRAAEEAIGLRATSVSGDLSAVAPAFRSLRANSVSGDVEIEGRFDPAGDHRVDTVSGDLQIGLVGGATVEVRGLSGDVSSALPHRLEGRLDRRRLTIGDGSSRIAFSSMSGDLRVAAPRRLPAEAAPAESSTGARAGTSGPAADLEVLQALERGEIDVEEAARRLSGR